LVQSWGTFTADNVNLMTLAANRPAALKLIEEVDFHREAHMQITSEGPPPCGLLCVCPMDKPRRLAQIAHTRTGAPF